jgi:hypothetical protein
LLDSLDVVREGVKVKKTDAVLMCSTIECHSAAAIT